MRALRKELKVVFRGLSLSFLDAALLCLQMMNADRNLLRGEHRAPSVTKRKPISGLGCLFVERFRDFPILRQRTPLVHVLRQMKETYTTHTTRRCFLTTLLFFQNATTGNAVLSEEQAAEHSSLSCMHKKVGVLQTFCYCSICCLFMENASSTTTLCTLFGL